MHLDLRSALERFVESEFSCDTATHRTIVAVQNTNGKNGFGHAISHQNALVRHDFGACGHRGEEHVPFMGGIDHSEGIDDLGLEPGTLVRKRDSAPGTDGIFALACITGAFKGQFVHRLAINEQVDCLPLAMANGDIDHWRTRVVINSRA